jgi:hypothetical protein
MARVFTTSFVYNHQSFDAIITIINRDNRLNFDVLVLNNAAGDLLPGSRVAYEGSRGFERLESLNNAVAQSFMRSLSTAIEAHMQRCYSEVPSNE